jgi:hypothetical protein
VDLEAAIARLGFEELLDVVDPPELVSGATRQYAAGFVQRNVDLDDELPPVGSMSPVCAPSCGETLKRHDAARRTPTGDGEC